MVLSSKNFWGRLARQDLNGLRRRWHRAALGGTPHTPNPRLQTPNQPALCLDLHKHRLKMDRNPTNPPSKAKHVRTHYSKALRTLYLVEDLIRGHGLKCLRKADPRLPTVHHQPAPQRPRARASALDPERKWTSACALPTADTVHHD